MWIGLRKWCLCNHVSCEKTLTTVTTPTNEMMNFHGLAKICHVVRCVIVGPFAAALARTLSTRSQKGFASEKWEKRLLNRIRCVTEIPARTPDLATGAVDNESAGEHSICSTKDICILHASQWFSFSRWTKLHIFNKSSLRPSVFLRLLHCVHMNEFLCLKFTVQLNVLSFIANCKERPVHASSIGTSTQI